MDGNSLARVKGQEANAAKWVCGKAAGVLVVFLFAAISLSGRDSADAAPRSHCSDTIPTAVKKVIHERYSSFHIRTKKNSRHGCPGIVKVDFYGDGRTAYAIVIQKDGERTYEEVGKLILASKESQGWKIELLNEEAVGSVSYAPADEFADMYGGKSAAAKGDVIVYFGYESWAVGYGWTSEKVEKVQLTD